MVWFKIDFHSGTPVYQQIIEQYKNAVMSGQLVADAPVPSIREMARLIKVNPNTVARAYRELENDGFIYSRPGVGSFISAAVLESREDQALSIVVAKLEQIIVMAHNYRISRDKLSHHIQHIFAQIYGGE